MKQIERDSLRFIKALNEAEELRFISHLDADGLCSASIVSRLLMKYNKKFHLSIVKQLEADTVDALKKEDYKNYIFTDIGSGQLNFIETLLETKKVIIIDHHPSQKQIKHPNLIEINPHFYEIDGGSEISASTLCYFIAKNLGIDGIEHLAIVGTIGDTQEHRGELAGINKRILEKVGDDIIVKKGLRAFGRVTKPLHKLLAYSTEIIPGVTGDESAAIQFLSELGINPKDGEDFRTISDLTEEEEKRLITEIILRRLGAIKEPENITSRVYTFHKNSGATRDAHEFSTFLNSCGRQGMQSVGLMLCLGDRSAESLSESISSAYKRKLMKALSWITAEKGSCTVETDEGLYIKGGDRIDDTLIGTVCSMIAVSNKFKKNFILGFAKSSNGLKVSGRVSSGLEFNMGDALKLAVAEVGGEAGGHGKAAGGKIPFGREDEFIAAFEKTIKNIKGQKL